ncbi:MAG: peptidoglycan DD-metalloendopeptidase family protein [Bacteroidota bacterium]
MNFLLKYCLPLSLLLYSFLVSGQKDQIPANELTFHIPANGRIASVYGWRSQKNDIGENERKFHKGIDIDGKYGEPVYAAGDGVVVFVGLNSGYGKFIEIEHNGRFTTAYGHLKKYCVKKGDTITAGQKIGEMGNSGTTFSTIGGKGIHLHFEIRDNTKKTWYSPKGAVNPAKYLKNYDVLKKYQYVSFEPDRIVLTHKPVCTIPFMDIIPDNLVYVPCPAPIPVVKPLEENEPFFLSHKDPGLINPPSDPISQISLSVQQLYSPANLPKKICPEQSFFSIQVEAHDIRLSEQAVKHMETKYKTNGIMCWETIINGKKWYKYTLGAFDTAEEAQTYRKHLLSRGIINSSAICEFNGKQLVRTIW